MLEQLLNLVKDHSQDAVVNNPAVPNQYNEGVQNTILDAIQGGLQNHAQSGSGSK